MPQININTENTEKRKALIEVFKSICIRNSSENAYTSIANLEEIAYGMVEKLFKEYPIK